MSLVRLLLSRVATYLVIALCTGFFAIPLLWLLSAPFDASPTYAVRLPKHFTLDSFAEIGRNPYAVRSLVNSVILAGGTMLVAVAVQSAHDNPITWDYVTSLRSIQIHLGGEFDKILAVLVVTGVLALAIARARHLLERAVAQQRAVADLSLFFDDSVARRITGSEADVMAGQGEQREATILFLDMRGFTEAAIATKALLGVQGDPTAKSVNAAFKDVKDFKTDILCKPWYYGDAPLHIPNNTDRTVTPQGGKMVQKEDCFPISDVDPAIKQVRGIEAKQGS